MENFQVGLIFYTRNKPKRLIKEEILNFKKSTKTMLYFTQKKKSFHEHDNSKFISEKVNL